MRDIGLTREQAEATMAREWKKFQKAFRRKAKIEDEDSIYHHNDEWKQREREGLDALRVIHPIKESGVVPWIEWDTLGSIDTDAEYWAARVIAPTYDYDTNERSLIKAVMIQTPHQRLGLTKDQAEHLRDQLIYELSLWEEE